MKNIFTICYSREEANEVGRFIMSKGYEGVQNDSYRYCDLEIEYALKKNGYHNIDHIYVGVKGCQMIVAQTKRGLRRKGLKYIEKKRMFYELLSKYGVQEYRFKIIETLSKIVEVEADDRNSAFEKVEEMIAKEEVVLTADDFEGREIYPYGNENK